VPVVSSGVSSVSVPVSSVSVPVSAVEPPAPEAGSVVVLPDVDPLAAAAIVASPGVLEKAVKVASYVGALTILVPLT